MVRPTKIGTVPIGFKTENKAANKYIKSRKQLSLD
jgi:hypothetical protein